jgi:hypothetical protein
MSSCCDGSLISGLTFGSAGFSAKVAEKDRTGPALLDCAEVTLTSELAATANAAIMMIAEISILPLVRDPFSGLQHEEAFPSDDWQQLDGAPFKGNPPISLSSNKSFISNPPELADRVHTELRFCGQPLFLARPDLRHRISTIDDDEVPCQEKTSPSAQGS